MKADKAGIVRALKAPGKTRLFLLYGPDEAGSQALANLLAGAMGPDAERIDLSGGELKADPARLADEAAAISLFGGARHILVAPAGEECLAAVEALLEAPEAGNPVVLVAGAVKPSSRLLKATLAAPDALAFISYVPDARDAPRLVGEIAGTLGLSVSADLARRIATSAGGNRAVMEQELAKYALYLDADPTAPKALNEDVMAAVGADAGDGDLSRLTDAVLSGRADALTTELTRLAAEGLEGIPLLRALLRRAMLLARLRAEVEAGASPDSVVARQGKAIFWKEKDAVTAQIARWSAPMLAKLVTRLGEAERAVKASGGLGPLAADAEMFAICRQAARLR